MLSHLNDNCRDHLIHRASRVLSDIESKYSAFEREALAVILALKKSRYYLIFNEFKLYTDLQALRYAFKLKDPHGRIAHWFTLQAEYNFEISDRAVNNNASVY